MKSKHLTKLLIAVQIVTLSFLGVGNTYAIAVGFSDTETSTGNILSTATLDLGMRSGQGNFVSGADQMERGDSVARDIYVQNIGDLSFAYRSSYEFKTGDELLCDILELKVWYNWYDAPPPSPGDHSTRHMDLVYSGPLQDFEDITNGDMVIPNAHEYFDNVFYDENEHWFYYQITVPEDAPYDASQKTCTFDIKTTAWQEDFVDETSGFWDEETIESTIGTADWVPTTPTGIRILNHNGEDIGCNGITNNRLITVDWDDNTEFDFHHYDYQNKDGGTIAQPTVSEFTGNIRDEDGLYKYRVRAVDIGSNFSNWTEWCYVTLDRTIEDAEEGDVVINEIMWMGSTESENDEWIELYNETDNEINLKNWVIENAGDGEDLVIPESYIIPAHGYFLIANFDSDDSNSALNVDVDWVTEDIDLDNDGEKLVLIDALGNEIDRTPDIDPSKGWEDGENDSEKHSMERNGNEGDRTHVGDGNSWDDWHTCTDAICNDNTYWDTGGEDDYGTPGLENHSEGDPSVDGNEEETIPEDEIFVQSILGEEDLSCPEALEDGEEDSSDEEDVVNDETIVEEDPLIDSGQGEDEEDPLVDSGQEETTDE